MSIRAMSWAQAQRTGNHVLKHVLWAIANYADEHGVCWPSQERLAFDTEMSTRSIRRALKDLEAGNFLHRKKRFSRPGANRQSDVLQLHLDHADNLAARATGHTGQTYRTECPPNHQGNHHLSLAKERKVSKVRGKPLRERTGAALVDGGEASF